MVNLISKRHEQVDGSIDVDGSDEIHLMGDRSLGKRGVKGCVVRLSYRKVDNWAEEESLGLTSCKFAE